MKPPPDGRNPEPPEDGEQLAKTNARLEAEIAARTCAGEERQPFNRAMVGRELRVVELRREVNALCSQAGLPPRYAEVEQQGL